jgi:glycosidase
MSFLVSRKSRDKYRFDESLFNRSGNVSLPDLKTLRRFAAAVSGENIRAGEINALGLMNEIFHHVIRLYKEQENPQLMEKASAVLQGKLGKQSMDEILCSFAEEFPSMPLYHGDISPVDYLEGTTDNVPHRHILLEEILMLWITGGNPAAEPYKQVLFDDGFFDDDEAVKYKGYKELIEQLELFFDSQTLFGPGTKKETLPALLMAPARAAPSSFFLQLDYIKKNWAPYLDRYLSRLLTALDIIREEEKFRGLGPGETPVYDFSGQFDGYDRFSPDHDWMPRLILIAKSTYVWLNQLSKKYQSPVTRLEQVPDEELDELARRGFTGLWLIGLWERSRASQKIKQMCGNPEAMASAYSIYDYRPADELGGESALNNLRHRAWQRGIRLAGDMVPNHMGIDSPWVVEHPDRFISLDYCPFPAYTFNGPDLSSDDRVSLFLEDHYYDRTDAAVVFKRVDNRSGEVRYIYHGNDGTAVPWNDTAQLNYLNPETREAVISIIFSAAEKFPVIRFDAAMTLTQKHYQRLWFPEPGSGGDIPTRSEYGMSRQEFLRNMPEEFWRRVVDTFSEAGSDTLLLAEAFWLMETHFVRTLGMHRVYNSAFMYFLKAEENAQFRTSIKNILQFNPQILKRFVNFMNNPDEETAAVQFGKDDKYFGVCTLMVTLPGLPMFGHGQIEGFTEKYGMEYRRAYSDETIDEHLLRRHEREIFPLLRKRYLFAEVTHFLFYDFHTSDGWINEDVIAFSNRMGMERCIVLYHNKFTGTSGRIKTSVSSVTLGDGLDLGSGENTYAVFRDQVTGLEYIRNNRELHEKGLYVELGAYKRNVFMDFRVVEDDEKKLYARLTEMLVGKGVSDINETIRKHFLNPLSGPFGELVDPVFFRQMETAIWKRSTESASTSLTELVEVKLASFYEAVLRLRGIDRDPAKTVRSLCLELERLSNLPEWLDTWSMGGTPELREAGRYALDGLEAHEILKSVLILRVLIHRLGEMMGVGIIGEPSEVWRVMEEWILTDQIRALFTGSVLAGKDGLKALRLLRVLTLYSFYPGLTMPRIFEDRDMQGLLGVNEYEGTLWFRKENAEEMFHAFFLASVTDIDIEKGSDSPSPSFEADVIERYRTLRAVLGAMERSGFRLQALVEEI